jgi:hypothetical protein
MAGINTWRGILDQKECLLSDGGGIALCYYAYALGAVSIVFTLAIGLLQFCTCNACSCGAAMDTVFAVMAAGWWAVGGFVVASNAARANAADLPKKEWRAALAWLCWSMAILFGAMFAVHLLRLFSKWCKCCGGRSRGGDVEKALAQRAPRPRSAALELGKEVRGRAYMTGVGNSSLAAQFRGDATI